LLITPPRLRPRRGAFWGEKFGPVWDVSGGR
jgi:hypothetical protein